MKTGAGSETEADDADEELGTADSDAGSDADKPASGVSVVQFTVAEGRDDAERLVSKLFKDSLIADAHIQTEQARSYMHFKKEATQDNLAKVRLVTLDERMPELLNTIEKLHPVKGRDMGNDVIATALTGGSDEYIAWVQDQCSKASLKKQAEIVEIPSLNDVDGLVQLGEQKTKTS